MSFYMEYVDQPPQIGDYAAELLDLHEHYWFFYGQSLSETDPDARAASEIAADEAAIQMEFFEEDPTTREQLEAIVSFTPPLSNAPEAVRVEDRRRMLTSLLADTSKHRGPINPTSIQARLDALPAPVYAPGFNREIRDVAAHMIRRIFGNNTPATPAEPAQPVQAPLPAKPIPRPSRTIEVPVARTPENGRELLPIKVYRNDLALEFPDGTLLPLRRNMEVGSRSDDEEYEIAKQRLLALQYINGLKDPVRSTEIWQRTTESGGTYKTSGWSLTVGQFLTNSSLQYHGVPLIHHFKPTPEAKRRYFAQGELNLMFDVVEGSSPNVSNDYFALPDGTILSAREAKLINLLLSGTKDNPVTKADFDAADIVPAEDRAKLKDADNIFSGVISTLRERLRKTGHETQFVVKRGSNDNVLAANGQPEPTYWIERIELTEAQRLNDTIIHQTTLLLTTFANRLASAGIKAFPAKDAATILRRYHNLLDEADDTEVLLDNLDKICGVKMTEQLMDTLDSNDPAYKLLEHVLSEFVDNEEKIAAVKKALLGDAAVLPPNHSESAGSTARHDQDLSGLSNNQRRDAEIALIATPVLEAVLERINDLGYFRKPDPNFRELANALGLTFKPKESVNFQKIAFKLVASDPAVADFIRKHPDHGRTINSVLGRFIHQTMSAYIRQAASVRSNGRHKR